MKPRVLGIDGMRGECLSKEVDRNGVTTRV